MFKGGDIVVRSRVMSLCFNVSWRGGEGTRLRYVALGVCIGKLIQELLEPWSLICLPYFSDANLVVSCLSIVECGVCQP